MTASSNLEIWPDPDTAARAWLARLKSGEATQRDLDSFKNWRAESDEHARSFERALRLWDGIGSALAGEAIAARPNSQSRPTSQPAMSRRLFLGGSAGVAAVAAVALTSSFSTPAGATRFETRKGERKRFRLEAEISVELNAASRIYYWPDSAMPRVDLEQGEALIAAACGDGRRLTAHANDVEVAARNARFVLRTAGDLVRVACLEGSVDVRSGHETRSLSSGRRIEIRHGDIQAMNIVPVREEEAAWQRNLLVFRDRPASEVVAELNRYRPGRVVLLSSKSDARITGVIHLDRAELAVDHIARSLGLRVTRLPGGIAILRS